MIRWRPMLLGVAISAAAGIAGALVTFLLELACGCLSANL
jgi:hypothetical protein